jgi:hypothetical protein
MSREANRLMYKVENSPCSSHLKARKDGGETEISEEETSTFDRCDDTVQLVEEMLGYYVQWELEEE